jgi:hypothetical protein
MFMNKTLIGYLHYEAKVKPHIKELVDRVDNMTDAEIDAANTPLPWFKIALKDLRDSRRVVELPEIPHDPNPMGTMVEWTSPEDFIKGPSRLEIEIKPGMLLWRPDTGGVWFEAVFCKTVDPKIFSQRPVARISKKEYLAAYQARLSRLRA